MVLLVWPKTSLCLGPSFTQNINYVIAKEISINQGDCISQSGVFQNGHSTDHALAELVDQIANWIFWK